MDGMVVDEIEWIDHDTAGKQTMWMEQIRSQAVIDDGGLIDWREMFPDVHTNDLMYAQAVFGEHGRLAHYCDVEESSVEVIGASNKGGDKQKEILAALDEYATVNHAGLIDISRVMDEIDTSERAVWANVGRYVRIDVPIEDYDPQQSTEGRHRLSPKYAEVFEDSVVPQDPFDAFEVGVDRGIEMARFMDSDR